MRANVSEENDTNPYNDEFYDLISVFNTGPDVGIDSIYSSRSVIAGQNNTIYVTMTSFWNGSSQNLSISLFENNTLIGTEFIPVFSAGGSGGGGYSGGQGGRFERAEVYFNYTPQSAGEREIRAVVNFSGDVDISDNTLSNNFTAYNLINVTINAVNSSGSPSDVLLISEVAQVIANQTPIAFAFLEGQGFILAKTDDPYYPEDYAYVLRFINVSLNSSESIVTDYYENLLDGVGYSAAIVNKCGA